MTILHHKQIQTMKTHGILCGLVAAVLLAACAAPGAQTGAGAASSTCTTPQCQLDVFVEGSPPRIRVSVDNLTVRGNQNVMIHWHLRNNDYEFKDDSIQFYDPRWTGQFSAPGTSGSGSQFHFTDRNSERGEWGYLIKVYEKRTGKWIPLDPTVINDGG